MTDFTPDEWRRHRKLNKATHYSTRVPRRQGRGEKPGTYQQSTARPHNPQAD